MLDIGYKLIYELYVIDILLDQQLLVEVVADPVGEFFQEKLLSLVNRALSDEFQKHRE